MDEVATLLSCQLFQDLSAAEIEPLARAAKIREYEQGDSVWRRGDVATHLYVVISGQVQNSWTTAGGQAKISAIYGEGGVLGEPGLFAANRIRIIDCRAATARTRLLQIDRDTLVEFLQRHPPAMLRMLELLADEFRAIAVEGVELAYTEIQDRVARKLLDLASTHGASSSEGAVVKVKITQTELARMVGASREQVNRALGRLVRAGLVVAVDGSYRLPDPATLESALSDGEPRAHRPGLVAARPSQVDEGHRK